MNGLMHIAGEIVVIYYILQVLYGNYKQLTDIYQPSEGYDIEGFIARETETQMNAFI